MPKQHGHVISLGDRAPDFLLPAVDGTTYGLSSFPDKSALVVIFSCNHCPYVQAYEDRLIEIQQSYVSRGVQLVAINSNDDRDYPEDSFEQMVERARMKRFNFPYLRDASQTTAQAYGATHTPQLFVFDRQRRLAYTGKIDDNWQDPHAVRRTYLRDALDAILLDKTPAVPTMPAIGCTIKWAS